MASQSNGASATNSNRQRSARTTAGALLDRVGGWGAHYVREYSTFRLYSCVHQV